MSKKDKVVLAQDSVLIEEYTSLSQFLKIVEDLRERYGDEIDNSYFSLETDPYTHADLYFKYNRPENEHERDVRLRAEAEAKRTAEAREETLKANRLKQYKKLKKEFGDIHE